MSLSMFTGYLILRFVQLHLVQARYVNEEARSNGAFEFLGLPTRAAGTDDELDEKMLVTIREALQMPADAKLFDSLYNMTCWDHLCRQKGLEALARDKNGDKVS